MKWNGTAFSLPQPVTVRNFLLQHGYDPERVAVERNGKVIRRAEFDQAYLEDQDTVEIVGFVGGG